MTRNGRRRDYQRFRRYTAKCHELKGVPGTRWTTQFLRLLWRRNVGRSRVM